jgi:RNA polymerase sigma factor (sigma-70 family)
MNAQPCLFRACRGLRLRLSLASPGGMAHIRLMAARDDPPASAHALGRALEDLREPLAGYFRRRVREPAEAADLVQEVFLRLSTRGEAERIEHLRSYVFQVASSVLADRHRRRTVRHAEAHVPFDPERSAAAEIGPERIVAGREALKVALAALDRLPERTRTVFVLRRLEAMPYRDIAGRLGISVSAVEKHMVRAVAHLAGLEGLR